jgi:hypothetical protein
MFDKAFLRSILLKAAYVVAASAVLGLSGFLDSNPDVALWSFDTLKIAVATSVVAGLKKFVTSFFYQP